MLRVRGATPLPEQLSTADPPHARTALTADPDLRRGASTTRPALREPVAEDDRAKEKDDAARSRCADYRICRSVRVWGG